MRAFSVVVASVLLAASGVCWAQPQAATPAVNPELERDGLAYPVSDLVFEYPIPHPMLPDLSVIENLTVTLTRTDEGYIAPIGTAYDEAVRLGDLGNPPTVLYGSALAAINVAIRDFLAEEYGLIGHLVTPSSQQIDYEGSRADLRAEGDTTLKIQIWRASIGEIRTLGYGQKWESFEKGAESGGALDQPEHARIREGSPLQQGDLLIRPPLDREIQQLNRHPGRRADLALSPTGSPGQVNLDYLITEARDWFVYGQVSNTGSKSTDEWVYRMGVQNNQLTGNDDILRLDYITAGFDETHAVVGSYEMPLNDSGRLRGKVFGRYNEYTANDVGFGFDDFEGQGYELGAEAALNLMQRGPLFIDAVGGARYESISVDNNITAVSGDDDFLIPYVGARAQRITPAGSFMAEALMDFGFGSDQAEAERLGRFGVDEDWTALRGSATLSFFLEPFLDPEGFDGERGPEAMTLAHEVYLSVRGQWSMGNRLVPNYQQVAGGFFTVRGYDESVAVGDNVVMATAEYRYHVGKAGAMAAEPVSVFGRPFRASRTEPFGSADWDVILRAFADVADVSAQDADPASETEDTLTSIGLGVEARLKQNLTLRVDYGYTLSGVGEGVLRRADSHDSRVHFMATLLF